MAGWLRLTSPTTSVIATDERRLVSYAYHRHLCHQARLTEDDGGVDGVGGGDVSLVPQDHK